MSDSEIIFTLTKDVDMKLDDTMNRIPDNERISIQKLTKFEKSSIIGKIAQNIAKYNNTGIDPLKLAEEKFYNNEIPIIIKRKMPNGKYELWKLSELLYSGKK